MNTSGPLPQSAMQFPLIIILSLLFAPLPSRGNGSSEAKPKVYLKRQDGKLSQIAEKETLGPHFHDYQESKLTKQPRVYMQRSVLDDQLQAKVLDNQEITSKNRHKNEVNKKNRLETHMRGKQIIQFQEHVTNEFRENTESVIAEHEASVPLLWTRMKPADDAANKLTGSKSRGSSKLGLFCSRTLSKTRKAFSRKFSRRSSSSQGSTGRNSRTPSGTKFHNKPQPSFKEIFPTPPKSSPPIIPYFEEEQRPEMTSLGLDFRHAELVKRNSRKWEDGQSPSPPRSPPRANLLPPIYEYGSFLGAGGNGSSSDKEGLSTAKLEAGIATLSKNMSEKNEEASPTRLSFNGRLTQAERGEVLEELGNRPYAPPPVAQDPKDKVSPLSLMGIFKPKEINARFRALTKIVKSRGTPGKNGSPGTPQTPLTPETPQTPP